MVDAGDAREVVAGSEENTVADEDSRAGTSNMSTIWIVAALLVAGAGFVARDRIRRVRSQQLDDDAIRRIELGFPVEIEEPLDMDEARAAEEEFWADPEEPDEFGG
ncbi:MAG: hypothetical protein ACYC28_02105 [Longimicrobiales bacterium]